ncbi:MAG: hypothetical protein ABGZ35_12120 [Planctomycetaceae bacterium]|jgi:hypothetical protein
MLHRLGIALQFAVMVALPLLVIGQLNFDFNMIVMPIALLAGVIVFSIGTKLRES